MSFSQFIEVSRKWTDFWMVQLAYWKDSGAVWFQAKFPKIRFLRKWTEKKKFFFTSIFLNACWVCEKEKFQQGWEILVLVCFLFFSNQGIYEKDKNVSGRFFFFFPFSYLVETICINIYKIDVLISWHLLGSILMNWPYWKTRGQFGLKQCFQNSFSQKWTEKKKKFLFHFNFLESMFSLWEIKFSTRIKNIDTCFFLFFLNRRDLWQFA